MTPSKKAVLFIVEWMKNLDADTFTAASVMSMPFQASPAKEREPRETSTIMSVVDVVKLRPALAHSAVVSPTTSSTTVAASMRFANCGAKPAGK